MGAPSDYNRPMFPKLKALADLRVYFLLSLLFAACAPELSAEDQLATAQVLAATQIAATVAA